MDAEANPFDEYDKKLAASDLRRYRTKGPRPWTRTLIEAIKTEGAEGLTLLDIGGGIGAIHHELLGAGVAHATCVEASAAYQEAARDETKCRGDMARVTFMLGDFVDLAESVPPADIVTLDRVVNTYPNAERLIELSADLRRRLYGIVLPRNTATAAPIHVINLIQRLRRKRVRPRQPCPSTTSTGLCEARTFTSASRRTSGRCGTSPSTGDRRARTRRTVRRVRIHRQTALHCDHS